MDTILIIIAIEIGLIGLAILTELQKIRAGVRYFVDQDYDSKHHDPIID